MANERRKVNEPKRAKEQGMARKGETFAPTRDVVSRLKDGVQIVVSVGALLSFMYLFFTYAGRLMESGPAPFPGRVEVEAVAKALSMRDLADDKVHQDQIDQLKQQADALQHLSDQQRAIDRERLVNRVTNAQGALDVAKALYEKDRTPENEKVVNALKVQLDDLHKQLMDGPAK